MRSEDALLTRKKVTLKVNNIQLTGKLFQADGLALSSIINERASKMETRLERFSKICWTIFGQIINFIRFQNHIRATQFSIAKEFQCYSCQSGFSSKSTSWVEPTYDSIRSKDSSLCWEIVSPSANVVSTGTTGQCFTDCYTQAYKYSLRTDSGHEFFWNIKRGCNDDQVKTSSLYGVKASAKCSPKFVFSRYIPEF